MSQFKSLKKPSLSQEVKNQIKASITSGTYKPGDKLPAERELMDQFEVSRVTVRDALRSLQEMGLITTKRGVNGGAYVSEPNPEPITESFKHLVQMGRVNFAHLIEARLLLEPDLTRNAAMYRDKDDINRLADLLDRAEEQVGSSFKKARLINVGFHLEVARIARNPLILFILESITQAFSALIIERTEKSLNRKTVLKLIGEHREILKEIISQNPDGAYEKTRDHLLKTYEVYAKVIPKSGEKVDTRLRYLR